LCKHGNSFELLVDCRFSQIVCLKDAVHKFINFICLLNIVHACSVARLSVQHLRTSTITIGNIKFNNVEKVIIVLLVNTFNKIKNKVNTRLFTLPLWHQSDGGLDPTTFVVWGAHLCSQNLH
jgi:hypothetical protein